MRRSVLPLALLAFLPDPALAQQEPPQPPELVRAGEAWSQCLFNGVENAQARQSPRTAARAIITQCGELQARMEAAHRAWIEGVSLSDRDKRQALSAMRRSLTQIESQLVSAIRQSRADD